MSIEVYPSYKNLVIAPVIPESDLSIENFRKLYIKDLTQCSLGFHNINQKAKNAIKLASGTYTADEQVFKCNGDGCFADKCKIRLATYLLKMDVFNALAAKYIQIPLIFPIQTVQIKDFTDVLPGQQGHFTTANTLALKHCDAIFNVFRNGEYARTCFENPFISFQFNADGKLYPRESNRTSSDERF